MSEGDFYEQWLARQKRNPLFRLAFWWHYRKARRWNERANRYARHLAERGHCPRCLVVNCGCGR